MWFKLPRCFEKKGGEDWLMKLRQKSLTEVQAELITLYGVGRKVADCVALFSLDKLDAVPIDTHVWQIACRDYASLLPALTNKSLNKRVYTQVGDFFRGRFGALAGWAQSVLFTADLAAFKARVPKLKK